MSGLWPDDRELPSNRDGGLYRLASGQEYFVSSSLLAQYPDLFNEHRVALTRYILSSAGDDPVEITTYNIDQIIDRQPVPTTQKLRILIQGLARLQNYQPKDLHWKTSENNVLFWNLIRSAGLSNSSEFRNLIRYLSEQGLANYHPTSSENMTFGLTVSGLIEAESSSGQNDSKTAFVAMWFSEEMNEAYTMGVVPAVDSCGYSPLRIDQREHNNKIDDEIISAIRSSRFVIADFSCGSDVARGGVYFEAGYAQGMDIPVIFCVRRSDLEKVHFDTRQYNHIVWADTSELFDKLKNRIAATIGTI